MVLEAKHIAKSFGKNEVLLDVTFKVEAGTMNGIAGENGSGKTTLLKIIVGEWKAKKGKITIHSSLGYCPQHLMLFPNLTIDEHFQYFAAAYLLDHKKIESRIQEFLDHFQYQKYRYNQVAHLSGGTKQKLNLTLSLLHEPGLLILDEPYNGFDWSTYLKFWEYVDLMKERGTAILIVSHLLMEKDRFDFIYNLKNGCME